MINLSILPASQRKIFPLLAHASFIRPFYLAGGTAIALQLGHRQSVDFDFIAERSFLPSPLLNSMQLAFPKTVIEPLQIEKNTLTVSMSGVKMSFFGGYRYPLLQGVLREQSLRIASLPDLLAMKLLAIQHRSEMKDYVDIFFLLTQGALGLYSGITTARKKFGKGFNPMISLKALTYFEDLSAAELQRIPFIHSPAPSWKNLQKTLREAVMAVKL